MGCVLLVTLIGVGAALMFLSKDKGSRPPKLAILDPQLSILSAQLLRGDKTHYFPHDGNLLVENHVRWAGSLEGRARAAVQKIGVGIDTLTALQHGKGLGGRLLSVYYAFPASPTSSVSLVAEFVAEDGKQYPLRSVGGASGNSPKRWGVWTLDSSPSVGTNYAFRLKTEAGGAPVAEITFTIP